MCLLFPNIYLGGKNNGITKSFSDTVVSAISSRTCELYRSLRNLVVGNFACIIILFWHADNADLADERSYISNILQSYIIQSQPWFSYS